MSGYAHLFIFNKNYRRTAVYGTNGKFEKWTFVRKKKKTHVRRAQRNVMHELYFWQIRKINRAHGCRLQNEKIFFRIRTFFVSFDVINARRKWCVKHEHIVRDFTYESACIMYANITYFIARSCDRVPICFFFNFFCSIRLGGI